MLWSLDYKERNRQMFIVGAPTRGAPFSLFPLPPTHRLDADSATMAEFAHVAKMEAGGPEVARVGTFRKMTLLALFCASQFLDAYK